MTDATEHQPLIKGTQAPLDLEAVRRWATSAAVVIAAGCVAYSSYLQYFIAREVSRGPDLYEVTTKLDEIDRSLGRVAVEVSDASPSERADPYTAMFEKDAGDVVNAIDRQTRVIETESYAIRRQLSYR